MFLLVSSVPACRIIMSCTIQMMKYDNAAGKTDYVTGILALSPDIACDNFAWHGPTNK